MDGVSRVHPRGGLPREGKRAFNKMILALLQGHTMRILVGDNTKLMCYRAYGEALPALSGGESRHGAMLSGIFISADVCSGASPEPTDQHWLRVSDLDDVLAALRVYVCADPFSVLDAFAAQMAMCESMGEDLDAKPRVFALEVAESAQDLSEWQSEGPSAGAEGARRPGA